MRRLLSRTLFFWGSRVFRIKICGITRIEDALLAVEAGADALGLNFFPASKRYVTPAAARGIVEAVGGKVELVGVFVNASVKDVRVLADAYQLDQIQLHGDESPEFLGQLGGRSVLRAFRCGEGGTAEIGSYLDKCQELKCIPSAALVDSFHPGGYGGTGLVAPWEILAGPRPWLHELPLVLAGGLGPENVAEAIAQVQPAAVDVASGVESAPGIKDPEKLRKFVAAARSAGLG